MNFDRSSSGTRFQTHGGGRGSLGLGLCLLEGVSYSAGGEGRSGECTGVGQETGKGDDGNRLHFELV